MAEAEGEKEERRSEGGGGRRGTWGIPFAALSRASLPRPSPRRSPEPVCPSDSAYPSTATAPFRPGAPPVGPLLLTPESSTVPGSYGVTIDCWTPGGMVGPATRGVWGHSLCSQETNGVASPGARGPAVGVRVT